MEKSSEMELDLTKVNWKDKIIDGFLSLVLESENVEAISASAICDKVGCDYAEFTKHFINVDSILPAFWERSFITAQMEAQSMSVYQEYTFKERYLAVCYSLIEQLKMNHKAVVKIFPPIMESYQIPAMFGAYKEALTKYIRPTLKEAVTNKEVAKRPFMDKLYPPIFMTHQIVLLKYLVGDQSNENAKTDEFIEKTVNLLFETLRSGVIDSSIDFIRFMIKDIKL